ncbi:MAG: ATP-dependent Clp protease adaptor ClpS, partial [Chlorobiales bacterium]|nr:ATP-dependent Clp protease adaptor ClpS [Chlorobiales bacterium]
VIDCIIEILDCNDQQAEQLTMLAHYKGSATVKEGPTHILQYLSDLLKNKGIALRHSFSRVIAENDYSF